MCVLVICVCFGNVWVFWKLGGCFGNCVGVSIIHVLVFTVFCIVCIVLMYCFVCVYLFLFVTRVRTAATE